MSANIDDYHFYHDYPLLTKGSDPRPTNLLEKIIYEVKKRYGKY